MRARSSVLAMVAICMLVASGSAAAQVTNPRYLGEMPSAERVMREVQGTDARDSAIRQICAFWQLQEIIKALAGPREFRGLMADENRLIQAYATGSYQVSQAYEKSLTPDEKRKFENEQNAYRFSRTDPRFGTVGVELFTRFFSAGFHAQFDQAIGADAARHQQFVRAQEQEQEQAAARAQAATASPQQAANAQPQMEARRCIAAGRDPMECIGEEFSGALGDLFGSVFPGAKKAAPAPGLRMSGVYPGQDDFRATFYEETVSIGCGRIVPDAHAYDVVMRGNQARITIQALPKPLELAFAPDGHLVGTGAVEVTGQVIIGYQTEEEYNLRTGIRTGKTIEVPVYMTKTESCTAGTMATSGSTPAAKGVTSALNDALGLGQTARDIAGSADTGPVPPGLRLRGTYAGQSGFNVEFHPDAAVVGCGAAAVAHAYTVQANNDRVVVNIQDATPLTLTMGSDGTLSGTGSVTVRGRVLTGANDNNITYAPTSATCAVGTLMAQGHAPGAAAQGAAAARASLAGPAPTAATVSPAETGTVPAPVNAIGDAGAAVLSIAASIGSQSGPATPLSSNAFLLLNDNLGNILKQDGFQSPQAFTAIKSHAVAAAKTDLNGKAAFPGVPPGTYYLMGMAVSNNQAIMWNLRIDLRPGANSVALNQNNAVKVH